MLKGCGWIEPIIWARSRAFPGLFGAWNPR